MESNAINRLSTFPRTNRVPHCTVSKRPLEENDGGSDARRKDRKLQKVKLQLPVSLQKGIGNPWQRYQKVFKLDQAGRGLVVHTKNDTFAEAFVKEVKVHSKEWLSRLTMASHRNIVLMQEALYHNGAIFFFYELMDVSLSKIFATPLGQLKQYEVAAFCHELLTGIHYIHETLKFAHGDLTSSNVLLSMDGAVKIANIGICMLRNSDMKRCQDDIRSVGRLVIECLEPITFMRKSDSLQGSWDPALVKFLESTETKQANELLHEDFLKLSPGPNCLKPYIRLARETTIEYVELVEQ
ncbi:hypothetical protein BBP40_007904 [Aspergillus hancockii]|nr:hypothetical protein BBP40_007904 [Aspergillus hancockii]